MTGLLHRLAARANGSAWTVRSDANLPFAAEGMQATLSAQEPQIEPGPLLQSTAPSTARAAHADAAPPDRLQAAAPSTHAHPSRLQQKTPWQTTAAVPAVAAPHPKDALQPKSPVPSENDLPPPAWPLNATLAPQAAAASPAARPLAAVAATSREPAPLLPPNTGVTNAASATMFAGPAPSLPMAPWTQRAPLAAHEETEVHIHIGRIDVTAVHAAAPKPRPPARERTQPVSLDAYLAARKAP